MTTPTPAPFPPRGYVSRRKEDGGLTHIILWEKYDDTPSEPYLSIAEHEHLLREARAKVFLSCARHAGVYWGKAVADQLMEWFKEAREGK